MVQYFCIFRHRWKNLNGGIEDNERRWQSDNEEENEDEQEDAEWRKQRFEREKYLKEQKAKVILNKFQNPIVLNRISPNYESQLQKILRFVVFRQLIKKH